MDILTHLMKGLGGRKMNQILRSSLPSSRLIQGKCGGVNLKSGFTSDLHPV